LRNISAKNHKDRNTLPNT